MPPDQEPFEPPPEDPPRKPLRPLPVFLALLLILIAATAAARQVLFESSGDGMGDGTRVVSPQPSLTPDRWDENYAKEIFDSLHSRLGDAYWTRDLALAREITAPGSRIRSNVVREIRQLLRDRVRVELSFDSRDVEIVSIRDNEIQLRQVLVSTARVVNDKGEDITKERRPELQTMMWILRSRQEGDWQLVRSLIVDASPIADD